jgi:hypothetical protein
VLLERFAHRKIGGIAAHDVDQTDATQFYGEPRP